MGVSNNDYNWRLVAGADIDENQAIMVNSAGKAVPSDGTEVNGFCPFDVVSGERTPVIRGGTLSELFGFSAGDRLSVQGDGTLAVAAATETVVAVVKAEDATTAVILTGSLDRMVEA